MDHLERIKSDILHHRTHISFKLPETAQCIVNFQKNKIYLTLRILLLTAQNNRRILKPQNSQNRYMSTQMHKRFILGKTQAK